MKRRDFIKQVASIVPALSLTDNLFASEARMRINEDAAASTSLNRRKVYLDELRSILPKTTSSGMTGRMNAGDKTWEDWLTRTGELPPDFSEMPSQAALPDPLHFQGMESRPVTTPAEWQLQKEWMRSQFEHWIYGEMPPSPTNLRAIVTNSRKDGDFSVRDVRLEFGLQYAGILRVQLFVPPGKGPFPVLLTNQQRYIPIALQRGYLGCFYNASDPKYGVPDDSDKFIDVYPTYDFACIARWAWAAMRAVDHLTTLPEVDQKRIAITGHSRNSKQALLAAAFDQRIGAVVAHSGGTGDCLPWRYSTDMFGISEGTIEKITGGPSNTNWFHPRLRFFAGREHKLPVDQNMLLSMIAPRGAMVSSGFAEGEGNPFGHEQTVRSAKSVYRFLGVEDKLHLDLRPGEHWPTSETLDASIDFLDYVFQRSTTPRHDTWVNGYTFEKWIKTSGQRIEPLSYPVRTPGDFLDSPSATWTETQERIRQNIQWALGEAPPELATPPDPRQLDIRSDLISVLFQRPVVRPGVKSTTINIGHQLAADVYYPETIGTQCLPTILWLHPYAYSVGYESDATPFNARFPFADLVHQGFVVIAMDQIGFGTRVLDARDFYERHPKWSILGKMLFDTKACMEAASLLEFVDPQRIYLAGYALGATISLFSAALHTEVRGVVALCGADSLRSEKRNETEGIQQYSHLHGLLPRLGFFCDHPARVPIDFDQILALAAPKKITLICPTLDRYVDPVALRENIDVAKRAYQYFGLEGNLRVETPKDFNRFQDERQAQVFASLADMARS